MTYPNTQLFINGQWCDAEGGRTLPVFNPSNGIEIGRFDGEQEQLASIAANAYTLDAARRLTCAGLDEGRKQVSLQAAPTEQSHEIR
mgnify:CR=1 FL=1